MHLSSLLFSLIFFLSLCLPNNESNTKADPLLFEDQIEWLTYAEAVERSKAEPRKILVDIYTDWCGWCKVMDRRTFGHEVIAQYVNERYYAVKLNAEMRESIDVDGKIYHYVNNGKQGYHELAIALTKGKMSFPTIVVLNEEQKISKVIPGYKKPKEMDAILKYYGENHYKSTPFYLFSESFRSRVK